MDFFERYIYMHYVLLSKLKCGRIKDWHLVVKKKNSMNYMTWINTDRLKIFWLKVRRYILHKNVSVKFICTFI